MNEFGLYDDVAAGEEVVDGITDFVARGEIRAPLGKQQHVVIERLALDDDVFGGVDRRGMGVGRDDRDRLAYVTDALSREQPGRQHRIEARQHWRHVADIEIGGGEHGSYAGASERRCGVDADERSVCVCRAHETQVYAILEQRIAHIGDVGPAGGQ